MTTTARRDGQDHARLAMLGAGRMGQAIIAGLLRGGWPADRITAAEAHDATAQAVREQLGVRVVSSIGGAVAGAELVVVAVKPHDVLDALREAAASLAPGATVVSIAAGLSTATLAAHLPDGTPVVRVMPNTPSLVGEGMAALSPAPGCPPASVALAAQVLEAVGQVREVPERMQDAVTAVSGSGPAYVFAVAEAMIDGGVLLGLPRPLAHDLTVQTLVGAAAMLRDSGEHPAVLREQVTSPGGTTAAALHELDRAAMRAAFAEAMKACRDRSVELGAS
ncbi:MAG TPA: pyrroline-5-carboxylate reductase [Candidatus Nanopelagicales bacterium]